MTRALRPVSSAHDGANSVTLANPTGTSLTPLQLEERGTIYRADEDRPEVNAFRDLRTQLLSMASGNFITLVAPVTRGSGGSFIARNLAVAFAFDETKSALLVDCDFRNPSQAATLRVTPINGGLIDYLENHDSNADSVLYDTGVPRLRLLPCGNSRETGAEYFSSFRMRLLLDSLRSRYPNCHIFLDAPPVKGAPDARILADLADVVVLVAGYGRDTSTTIAEASSGFDKAKLAGVVFNEGI